LAGNAQHRPGGSGPGAAAASQARSGDSDALQQNYLTPGLSGGSVTTVNGTTSFTPNLACQKTATMVEILAQPSSTGDLGTLTISRDKDLDGTFDEALGAQTRLGDLRQWHHCL
jgi:hypothetical protein